MYAMCFLYEAASLVVPAVTASTQILQKILSFDEILDLTKFFFFLRNLKYENRVIRPMKSNTLHGRLLAIHQT